MRRRQVLESLEGRALMANITASAVVTSMANGAAFDDTIKLTNSSSSTSGIGTFWYGWQPGQDYLATSPLSVTPPAGWTDNITHFGSGDGYAIQFVASNAAYDVQPGQSLNFSFKTADRPASINGDSMFFPGTPVGTSTVYPGAPFSDNGHVLVVTAGTSTTPPTSPPTPPSNPPPRLSILAEQPLFQRMINKRGRPVGKPVLFGFKVDFSAPLNPSSATDGASYQVDATGTKRVRRQTVHELHPITSFTVSYVAATDSVILTFTGKRPTFPTGGQLEVLGGPSGGVTGASGEALGGTTGFKISPGGRSIGPL